jgi:hypothetical protein
MLPIKRVDNKIRVDILDQQILFDDFESMYNLAEFKNCPNKVKWQVDSRKFWYSHDKECKKIYLLDLLFKITPETHDIIFENNNYNDYTTKNIKFKKIKEEIIEKPENIIILESFFNKHYFNYFKVYETFDKIKKEFYMIDIKNNNFIFVNTEFLDTALYFNDNEIIWKVNDYGYVEAKVNDGYFDRSILLNKLIVSEKYEKKERVFIDHINKNKLDCRLENMRINNCQTNDDEKRKRQKNARDLPDGITNDMIPKYVVYYNSCYNKEKNLFREFFQVEGHPKSDGKRIATTKSNSVSILEKLKEAKEIIDVLEGRKEQKIKPESLYPKGIYLKETDDGKTFIFDLRKNNMKYNLKMVCKGDQTDSQNLEVFKEKINKKYPDYVF